MGEKLSHLAETPSSGRRHKWDICCDILGLVWSPAVPKMGRWGAVCHPLWSWTPNPGSRSPTQLPSHDPLIQLHQKGRLGLREESEKSSHHICNYINYYGTTFTFFLINSTSRGLSTFRVNTSYILLGRGAPVREGLVCGFQTSKTLIHHGWDFWWIFLTVLKNFMLVCVISCCWWQIRAGGVAWSVGGRSLWDSQTTTTSTSTLGVGEGNTEKGWKVAKIDDPNKIFN